MSSAQLGTEALGGTVVDRLRGGLEGFGRQGRLIARFFIDHAEELPFLSAGEIAERLGVSGAAITRFSQRVGCEGYPHLQRLVRAELRAELRATLGLKRPGPQDAAVARFWAGERANLGGLAALPEGELLTFATLLARARQVWLVGARSSYGLALTAEYLLSSFRPRVQAYAAEYLSGRPEHLLELGAEDAVWVFTVRRYSRATTAIATALSGRGVSVLLLTDQGASPLAKLAARSLRVPTRVQKPSPRLPPWSA